MKPQVYLDSSDYSTLTDPLGVPIHLLGVKDQLLSWSKSQEVVFRFSGVHVSEISPTETLAEDAAEARTNFLSELCGDKCLLSIDQLIHGELENYALGINKELNFFSDDASWFPVFDDGIFSVLGEDRFALNTFLPKLEGLPREIRRKAEQQFFKNGRLRSDAKIRIIKEADSTIKEILKNYPMRRVDADVLIRYFMGDASKSEADNAFYESLRDPKWMMQWFRHHRDHMLPVIEWLRGPAKKMYAATAAITQASINMYGGSESQSDSSKVPLSTPPYSRSEMRLRWIKSISTTILKNNSLAVPDFSLTRIEKLAPGFCTGVSTSIDMIWASTSKNPRVPMASDFVDAVHSMYAPYVDIYRADSFMAPIVSKHVNGNGTIVVSKLANLVSVIKEYLSKNSS